MRDPDTGLLTEFLPIYASVPIARLEEAYQWAHGFDHPECRYALWAIARNAKLPPGSCRPCDGTPGMSNIVHLNAIFEMFERFTRDGSLPPAPSELSYCQCDLTTAAAALDDPYAEVLRFRLMTIRASFLQTPARYRKNTATKICYYRSRLAKLLKNPPPSGPPGIFTTPIPRLRDALLPEEITCREALCWARLRTPQSRAFRLFQNLSERTRELDVRNQAGTLSGTQGSAARFRIVRVCGSIARLYLVSHSLHFI